LLPRSRHSVTISLSAALSYLYHSSRPVPHSALRNPHSEFS
jgi:hypothetical protein